MDAKDEVILQIGKKVEADPSLAGVAEARKVFEAKKAGLMAKRDAIKQAPQGMNSDWLTRLIESEANDRKYFTAIAVNLGVKCKESCSKVSEQFQALEKDFMAATDRNRAG